MTNYIERIRGTIDHLSNRYDAENDVIPGAPAVTYVDMRLLDAIGNLVHVVEGLQSQIDELKSSQTQVTYGFIDDEIGAMRGRDLDEILRGYPGSSNSENGEEE